MKLKILALRQLNKQQKAVRLFRNYGFVSNEYQLNSKLGANQIGEDNKGNLEKIAKEGFEVFVK
jgi:hypothetical protein